MVGKHQTIILGFKRMNFKLGALYRDHRSGTVSQYLDYFDKLLEVYSNCLFVGDMNIDILKENSNKRNYECTLASNNFLLINKVDPQFFTFKPKLSLLDHAFTDIVDRRFNFSIFDDPISDHKALILSLSVKDKCAPQNGETRLTTDYGAIKQELVERCDQLVDFELFFVIFCGIMKRFQALALVSAGRMSTPWFCNEIREAIDVRNYWYRRHRQFPSNTYNRNRFRYFKNLVVAVIRKRKRQYYCNLINSTVSDAKKLWRVLNLIIYNRVTSTAAVSVKGILDASNVLIVTKKGICDAFNSYFVEIAGNLREELRRTNNFKPVDFSMKNTVLQTAVAHHTDVREMLQVVDSLNNNAASGIDGISLRLIKYCFDFIAPILISGFNGCLDRGIFPNLLKTSKTVPIHKTGSKSLPSNYRPISIQTNFAKIFEKLIYRRLESFYVANNFFNASQFGFVPKSNTASAVLNFVTFLRNSLNDKNYTAAIFVDMSKAFDCVVHEILLDKLYKSGIRGNFFDLMRDYLTGRSQVISINGVESEKLRVKYGVPQGSVLGPLLFLVYINDIFDLKLKGRLQLYADDVIIMYSNSNVFEMYDDMEHDLALLYDWFYDNCLTVNSNKTSFIVFKDPRKRVTYERALSFGHKPISQVQETKYLGIIIDSSLSFVPHIDNLKKKIIPYVVVLHRIKGFVPISARLSIYYAYIHSQLCYMNAIWSSAAKDKILELCRLQNKAIRSVFFEEYRNPQVHTHNLYTTHDLLKLDGQNEYELVLLVYKIKHNLIKHSFTFPTNRQFHRYETRRKNDFYLHKINNNYGRKSIMYLGLKSFNRIPGDLKAINNLDLFKQKLKKYFLSRQV
jgi:Reverse transcriptase (RNA-dependent DNA polymerase)